MTITLSLPLQGVPLAALLDSLPVVWRVVDDEAGRPMFSRGEGPSEVWEYVPHPRAGDYVRRLGEAVQAIVNDLPLPSALEFIGEVYRRRGQPETAASTALAERVARAWGLRVTWGGDGPAA